MQRMTSIHLLLFISLQLFLQVKGFTVQSFQNVRGNLRNEISTECKKDSHAKTTNCCYTTNINQRGLGTSRGISTCRSSISSISSINSISSTKLNAAPKEALSDIVIPGVFEFPKDELLNNEKEEDPRIWVPQTECLSFRPLCFCVSQGYYVNLLKFKGGGILGKHRHSSPVHALTLKGSWGYKEHGWNAKPGTYVFEPPGETHTLVVDEDCDEMITMFHVTGTLLYVDEDGDDIIGFDDVFSKLEKAKKWYKECGLGEDYVQQFVR